VSRVAERVGRRGAILVVLGGFWVVIGLGALLNPGERFTQPGATEVLAIMDAPAWGLLWTAGGLVALVAGLGARRWPHSDWGFAALAVPSFIWGWCYAWSWMLWHFTDGAQGRDVGWGTALVYWALTVGVLFAARAVNPPPSAPPPPP